MLGIAVLVLSAVPQGAPLGSKVVQLHRSADEQLVAGDGPTAAHFFQEALALAPDQPTLLYGLACAWARAGERDPALASLNRAAERGYADAAVGDWDPDLASIRGDVRWPDKWRSAKATTKHVQVEAVRKLYDPKSEWQIVAGEVDRTGTWAALAVNHFDHDEGAVDLLDARTGRRVRRIASLSAQVGPLAFDRDAGRVAVLDFDSKFWFVSTRSDAPPRCVGRLAAKRPHDAWPFGVVSQSPTGNRWIVASNGLGALLVDDEGNSVREWNAEPAWKCSGRANWSPDGKRLALLFGGEVHFFDSATGAEAERPFVGPGIILDFSFDPDGMRFATAHSDAHVRVWNLETRQVLLDEVQEDLFENVQSVNRVAFSPDGSRLAFTSTTAIHVGVLDLSTKKRVYDSGALGGRMGEPADIAWSGDSRRLWSAFISSVMWLDCVEIAPKVRDIDPGLRSGPLRTGSSCVGVSIHFDGAIGIDTNTGGVLWRRAAPGGLDELVHTPEGYFTSDSDDFGSYRIRVDDRNQPEFALAEHALTLFDPKRVRARAAGIELVVPKL